MNAIKEKILVVDDEVDVLNALTHFICAKGYDAIGALTGEEALKILENIKVDLILLDLRLPGLSGSDIAKIVKDRYPSLKLIVITAHPEEVNQLPINLAEGLLTKPVGIQELYKKIATAIQHDEAHILSQKPKQKIKASVLLIKAKLLILESCVEIYNTLHSYFAQRSNQGEDYKISLALNPIEVEEKIRQDDPDILIFNMACFDTLDKDFIERILARSHKPKEVVIYRASPSGVLEADELARLSKAVQTISLKNGLIEVKWVEI